MLPRDDSDLRVKLASKDVGIWIDEEPSLTYNA